MTYVPTAGLMREGAIILRHMPSSGLQIVQTSTWEMLKSRKGLLNEGCVPQEGLEPLCIGASPAMGVRRITLQEYDIIV